jgi:phage terminase large subunit-like protein
LSGPKFSATAGDEAIELARHAGLVLDPWQQLVLRQSLGEGADGKWAAFEVGLLVARQNGKGAILEARELWGLFLGGERLIMHSAHLYKTSVEAYRRIKGLIQNTPDLHKRVLRYPAAHGEEGIELKNGARLQFVARTKGSGRGFSGDCVILDEAYNLDDGALTALMPTMSARPNPQLWYTSSAGNEDSAVLGRVVRRGLKGDPSLAYMDWSVPHDVDGPNDDIDVDDQQGWAQANPGLGIRITAEHVTRERRALDRVGFARERLGVGTYPAEETEDGPIPMDAWVLCVDPESQPVGKVAFGVDMTLDRSRAAIGVAGHRSDGVGHVEVADARPGSRWIVERVKDLRQKWRGPVVIDPAGPAGSLIPELEDAGVEVTKVTARDLAQACGAFHDVVCAKELRHLDDPRLTDAVRGARVRSLSDAWAFDRRTSGDASPLLAVVLARHAASKAAVPNIW